MKPLEQKNHLEREQNIGWYGYEAQVDTFYDHTYTTYPGINYIVKDAAMIRTYQLWLRIEVDNRLFTGFCVFDPAASSKEGLGNQVDDYDKETRNCVEQILKVTKADQSVWWAFWRYLPTGSVKESSEVPDFKALNDAAFCYGWADAIFLFASTHIYLHGAVFSPVFRHFRGTICGGRADSCRMTSHIQ